MITFLASSSGGHVFFTFKLRHSKHLKETVVRLFHDYIDCDLLVLQYILARKNAERELKRVIS